jgi:cytochrome c-type biogenesis protein CcmH
VGVTAVRLRAYRRSASVQRLAWLVLGVVVATALAIGWSRATLPPRAARIAAIEADVKCPSCEDLSVAVSTAPTAVAVRSVIVHRVDAGQSTAAIEQYLVSRYGPSILLRPPTTGGTGLVWEIPLAVGALSIFALAGVFWRRRSIGTVAVSESDLDLVRRALEEPAGQSDGGAR